MPRRKGKPKKPAKARRPKGTGSVLETADGVMGRVPIGKYPNGRTKYTEVRARNKTELEAKMRLVLPPGPDTTVEEWSVRWLEGSGASEPTKDDYRHTLKHFILPDLGTRRIADLTTHDVERCGVAWGKKLDSPNTVRKNLGHLATMLEAARRDKLLTENPAADAQRPKARKVEINPFAPAELARIIADGAQPFVLLAAVGCRIGESLALDVTDFDAAAGTISITKTYSHKHGVRRPKSENGVRTIRVPASALPAIRAAIGTRTKGPLFPNEVGGRMSHQAAHRDWGRLITRLGLEYRNGHQLRHSVATALVASG
ncbi:MAG TPA: site-specific integrase, partial [Gemmata sp.]